MEKKTPFDFEIAPLRSLDDFLMESARFQIPNVKNMDKWSNRVINNLLFYQTNYFLLTLIIFIIVGVIHPVKMASGCIIIALIALIFYYVTNEAVVVHRLRKKHPLITVLLIFSGGYLINYAIGSLLVFFLGILLPISVTFMHASLRLRNIKNKISNRVETLGLKRTPMGIFLEELGLEIEV